MKAKASKKHAKPTRRAKGGKFHHKMKRHYDDGGGIDVGPIDMGGHMPNIDDAMSFSTAFKLARAAGKPTFPWRGKRYTTQLAGAQPSAPSAAAPSAAPAAAPSAAPMPPPSRTTGPGMDISGTAPDVYGRSSTDPFSMRPSVNPEEYSQQARMEGTLGRLGTLGAAVAGPEALGAEAGEGFIGKEGLTALKALKKRGQLARNLGKATEKSLPHAEAASGMWNDEFGLGIKRGGKIKAHKYAAGGSIRGGGCESKGKTKGSHR